MHRILVAQIVIGGVLIIFEDGETSYFPSEVLHQHRLNLGLQALVTSDRERPMQ